MSSKKVEFIADRLKAKDEPDATQRALKHFDSARKKLEKLQAVRKQMKAQLVELEIQRDTALELVEELTGELESEKHELHDSRIVAEAQANQIAILRAECDRLSKTIRRRPARVDAEDEGPALTVLAMEKAAAQAEFIKAPHDLPEADTAGNGEIEAGTAEPEPSHRWIDRLRGLPRANRDT